jgi:hypothetical protein
MLDLWPAGEDQVYIRPILLRDLLFAFLEFSQAPPEITNVPPHCLGCEQILLPN